MPRLVTAALLAGKSLAWVGAVLLGQMNRACIVDVTPEAFDVLWSRVAPAWKHEQGIRSEAPGRQFTPTIVWEYEGVAIVVRTFQGARVCPLKPGTP